MEFQNEKKWSIYEMHLLQEFFDIFKPYHLSLYKFSFLNMLSEEAELQKANV